MPKPTAPSARISRAGGLQLSNGIEIPPHMISSDVVVDHLGGTPERHKLTVSIFVSDVTFADDTENINASFVYAYPTRQVTAHVEDLEKRPHGSL